MHVEQQTSADEMAGYADWAHRLRHGSYAEQLAALRGEHLAYGALADEPLAQALLNDENARIVRSLAADVLAARGAAATPALIAALGTKDRQLKTSIVRALGKTGDARALQPLLAELNSKVLRRSARIQRWVGNLLLIMSIFVGIAVGVSGTPVGLVFGALFGTGLRALFEARWAAGGYIQEVAEALARIGEREPHPEFRGAMDQMRGLARDTFQHRKETRDACLDAAARIDQATAHLKSLPLAAAPADPAGPDRVTLPTPAQAPNSQAESLPRVQT